MTANPVRPSVVDLRLGRIIAWSGLLLTVAAWSRIGAQTGELAAWWSILAAVPVVALLVAAIGGMRLPVRAVRIVWTSIPVTVVAAHLLVFAAYTGDDADSLRPWIGALGPIAVAFLPLVVPHAAFAIAVAVVVPFALALSGLFFLGGVPDSVQAMTPLHVGTLAVLVIVMGARARLRRLAEAEEGMRRLARRRDEEAVVLDEQRRVARLVHDDVLSVLTAALRLPGRSRPEVREAAARGLRALRSATRSSVAGEPDRELDSAEAGREIVRVAESIAADADLQVALRAGTVPADVLDRSSQALGEALRNSIRHAGDSDPRVTATIGGDELRVVVSDRGPGFDPASTAADRMGVRLSILERMRSLPGGSAQVRSGGEGTRVELGWRRVPTPVLDSGLATPNARIAMVLVWASGIVHSALVGLFPAPTPAIGVTCLLVALIGVLIVTAPRPGRLPRADALIAVACSTLIALCVLAYADIADSPAGEVWLLTFASYLVALICARGNPVAGSVGAGLIVALLCTWGVATHQSPTGLLAMATPTVVSQLVGIVWFVGVRRMSRRETGVRTDALASATGVLAAAGARRRARRELAGILRLSRPLFERLAAGADVDEHMMRELAGVEGAIRDRIRAPGLHHPVLADALRAARERGVRVLLLGAEDHGAGSLPVEIAASILGIVSDDAVVSLTIRELPGTTTDGVSVVAERADGSVRRTEYRALRR